MVLRTSMVIAFFTWCLCGQIIYFTAESNFAIADLQFLTTTNYQLKTILTADCTDFTDFLDADRADCRGSVGAERNVLCAFGTFLLGGLKFSVVFLEAQRRGQAGKSWLVREQLLKKRLRNPATVPRALRELNCHMQLKQ